MYKIQYPEFIDQIDAVNDEELDKIQWKDLNKHQKYFVRNLIKEKRILLRQFKSNLGKRGGISCKNGLPITIKILNVNLNNKPDKRPALKKHTILGDQWLVLYFGISPELENFVSLVLWPKSNSSKKCFTNIREILEYPNKALKLEGAYHIRPPNEIHPQHVKKIEIKSDGQLFYNWQYFPFIKDVGDSLLYRKPSINYKKVLLRNSENISEEEYMCIRVTVGSILDINGREIKVKLPFLNTSYRPLYFYLRPNITGESINKGDIYSFLLIEKAGESQLEVYALENISRIEALAHTISYELYNRFMMSSIGKEYKNYLLNIISAQSCEIDSDLNICSLEELKRIFDNHINLIYRIAFPNNVHEKMPINLFKSIFNVYLSAYFQIDKKNNQINYKPPILN